MDKLNDHFSINRKIVKFNSAEDGFTYVETIIAMLIVTVGLLATLSAITYALVYSQITEKKTQAKEISGSIVENIFAIRDIQSQGGLAMDGWESIQIKDSTNAGIFEGGWYPVRQAPGADGIYGTTDDSCAFGSSCGNIAEIPGYERKISITNITENGVVRKRNIAVSVRYRAIGSITHEETISTIIGNLPINDK